jgi:hypothetical protein
MAAREVLAQMSCENATRACRNLLQIIPAVRIDVCRGYCWVGSHGHIGRGSYTQLSKEVPLDPILCSITGRELTLPETFVNVGVDGDFTRENNDPSDDWRPIGRECVRPLRDRGVMLSGLVTPL